MSARPTKEEINLALTSGVRVNPSRIDTHPGTWTGSPTPGSRWTVEQIAKLEQEREQARALDSGFGRAVAAKLSNLERVEGWNVDLLTHHVECPLLARSRDRAKVLVVAPGGDKLWINAR